MPTPTGEGGFDSVKHLLKILVKTQALIVRDTFRDISDSDARIAQQISEANKSDTKADNRFTKMAMKLACTPEDDDSATTILLKLFLFYFVFRKARDLYPEIYGIPNLAFQEKFKFLPQIKLYFLESSADIEPGFSQIDADLSFRLVGETPASLSELKIDQIAQSIWSIFTGNGQLVYHWKKGQTKCTYRDMDLGYNTSVFASDLEQGIRVIKDILKIQNHPFDELKLIKSNYGKSLPTIPENQKILGRIYRKPRQRPTGIVHFRYAELHLHGLPRPIVLVDATGQRKGALYRKSPWD